MALIVLCGKYTPWKDQISVLVAYTVIIHHWIKIAVSLKNKPQNLYVSYNVQYVVLVSTALTVFRSKCLYGTLNIFRVGTSTPLPLIKYETVVPMKLVFFLCQQQNIFYVHCHPLPVSIRFRPVFQKAQNHFELSVSKGQHALKAVNSLLICINQ